MKRGNLIRSAKEVIRWRAFGISVNETKARNTGTPEDEIDAAIKEALATVWAERSDLRVDENRV